MLIDEETIFIFFYLFCDKRYETVKSDNKYVLPVPSFMLSPTAVHISSKLFSAICPRLKLFSATCPLLKSLILAGGMISFMSDTPFIATSNAPPTTARWKELTSTLLWVLITETEKQRLRIIIEFLCHLVLEVMQYVLYLIVLFEHRSIETKWQAENCFFLIA